jgi:hypothetical protein
MKQQFGFALARRETPILVQDHIKLRIEKVVIGKTMCMMGLKMVLFARVARSLPQTRPHLRAPWFLVEANNIVSMHYSCP